MKTLPLDWNPTSPTYWDLTLDGARNWTAISSETIDDQNQPIGEAKYAAQTVANSVRQFVNDAYYFKNEGLPYFENVLGEKPPQALVEAYIRQRAEIVPLTTAIEILQYNYDSASRVISGDIRVYTVNGGVHDVSIG